MLETPVPVLGPPPFVLGRPAFLGPARLAQGMPFPGMGPATAADQLTEQGAVVELTIKNPAGGSGAPVTLKAMIDTGASISTVVDSVAQRAGLQQTGSTQLSGVGGVQTSPIYAASLVIPQFNVEVPAVEVASIPNPLPDVEMLIGRDILRALHLDYHGGAGNFVLVNENVPGGGGPAIQSLPGGTPMAEGGGLSATTLIVGGLAAAALAAGALFAFKVI